MKNRIHINQQTCKYMDIEILHLIEGAKKAKGLAVVIDVFRAFSLACYIMDKGAKTIIPVGDIDIAYQLKEKNPKYVLVGERNEKIMPGFDFGNSPFQIKDTDLTGKTVVHTTSAGTQGLVNTINADETITGSFVNADAIIRYIQMKNPDHVSLVCMGYAASHPTEEDTFCAEYIQAGLQGEKTDYDEMVKVMRQTSGARFFIPEKQSHAPSEDFYLCTKKGIFNFVLIAEKSKDNHIHLKKI